MGIKFCTLLVLCWISAVWSYLSAIHTHWKVYCSCLAYLHIITMRTLSTHLNLTKHQEYHFTTSKEGNSVINSTTTNSLTFTLNKLFLKFYKRNVCQCQNSQTWNSTYKCNLRAFLQQQVCLKQNQHHKSGLQWPSITWLIQDIKHFFSIDLGTLIVCLILQWSPSILDNLRLWVVVLICHFWPISAYYVDRSWTQLKGFVYARIVVNC